MDGKIISLEKPIEAFNQVHTEIALREPKGSLFSRLGLPRIPVFNQAAGSAYLVEQNEVIASYIDALVDIKDAAAKAVVISSLSLVDAIKVRDALFSFFEVAAAKAAAKP